MPGNLNLWSSWSLRTVRFHLCQHSDSTANCGITKNHFRSFWLGRLFYTGQRQQSLCFYTKNSSQVKIRFQLWHKKQSSRLAGSFLNSWQWITINSLLPMALKEICCTYYWKGENVPIRTLCSTAAFEFIVWKIFVLRFWSSISTTLFSNRSFDT